MDDTIPKFKQSTDMISKLTTNSECFVLRFAYALQKIHQFILISIIPVKVNILNTPVSTLRSKAASNGTKISFVIKNVPAKAPKIQGLIDMRLLFKYIIQLQRLVLLQIKTSIALSRQQNAVKTTTEKVGCELTNLFNTCIYKR